MTARVIQLNQAEIIVTRRAARVKTVLGSCLCIAMRAPRLGLTALSHCLLPTAAPADRPVPDRDAGRYVDSCIALMLRLLSSRGASTSELEVRLYGGAETPAWSQAGGPYRVGGRNVEMALAVLAAWGITPGRGDVLGPAGRVLVFDTGTGEAELRMLPVPERLPREKQA